MNLKLILGLLALVGIASAVPLGPYSIDYGLEDAIYTPIAQVREFTTDGVNATACAAVVLAPDGWALIIVNDFEEEVGLSESDVWAPFGGGVMLAPMEIMIDGCKTKMSTDGKNWRTVWTVQAEGWEDGILYGTDTVAVTTGGWDRLEVEAFLESIEVTKTSQQEISEPEMSAERANVLEGTVVLGDSSTAARLAAYREAGLQMGYIDVVPV